MTSSTGPALVRVAVGIPTYRRPELLGALLAAIPDRAAELAPGVVLHAVVVVDNDPAASARTAAEGWASRLPVDYSVEPQPGIAAVRNRVLDRATALGADVLAFIDDDEVPQPQWLSALVDAWDGRYAAVTGRVLSRLPDDVDPWIVATGTFTRKVRTSGDEVSVAAAGNLLLDLAQVRRAGVRFDTTLGLAGGEDTLFTAQLHRAGGRIVWCGESVAVDTVVPARVTRSWARTRAFMNGNSAVQAELRVAGSAPERAAVRAMRLAGGVLRIGVGALRHAFGRASGRLADDARGWRLMHRGRGMAAGAVGHVHQEYARGD